MKWLHAGTVYTQPNVVKNELLQSRVIELAMELAQFNIPAQISKNVYSLVP